MTCKYHLESCVVFVFIVIIILIYLFYLFSNYGPSVDIYINSNTPVSSYDWITSLCGCSSVSEARKVFVYINGGTDAA